MRLHCVAESEAHCLKGLSVENLNSSNACRIPLLEKGIDHIKGLVLANQPDAGIFTPNRK
jgi:hypothetical protein